MNLVSDFDKCDYLQFLCWIMKIDLSLVTPKMYTILQTNIVFDPNFLALLLQFDLGKKDICPLGPMASSHTVVSNIPNTAIKLWQMSPL